MASFRKRGRKWLAEVRRKGVYKSETFYTKAEAQEWARALEVEIDTGKRAARTTATLGDAFERYAEEVSPTHKGERWEKVRLKKLGRDVIADIRFKDLDAEDFSMYRDRRLKEVKSSTVNRELNLMSGVITTARREWGWTDINPLTDVRRPRNPQHRDRRISDDEIDRICLALGWDNETIETSQQETAAAFLIALETTMRQGEIVGLKRSDVFLKKQYVVVEDSKNHQRKRPSLSLRAVELLEMLMARGEPRLFRVAPGTVSTLFRRARIDAGIEGLTFHDSRHESATRLARKLDVMTLAAQMGVKDLKTLMIYFNPTATEIAKKLG